MFSLTRHMNVRYGIVRTPCGDWVMSTQCRLYVPYVQHVLHVSWSCSRMGTRFFILAVQLQVFLDLTPSHMCAPRAASSRRLVVAETAVATRRRASIAEAMWQRCNHLWQRCNQCCSTVTAFGCILHAVTFLVSMLHPQASSLGIL